MNRTAGPVVEAQRINRSQRLLRAGFDVGDVLLVPATSSRVASLPRCRKRSAARVVRRSGGSLAVPGQVLAEVEVVDRQPAGIDDVDEHERVVVREVNVDVVRRMVGAMPGELNALPGHLQRVAVGECHPRSGRVVIPQQEPAGLLVSDANRVVEERGGARMVGVVV